MRNQTAYSQLGVREPNTYDSLWAIVYSLTGLIPLLWLFPLAGTRPFACLLKRLISVSNGIYLAEYGIWAIIHIEEMHLLLAKLEKLTVAIVLDKALEELDSGGTRAFRKESISEMI